MCFKIGWKNYKRKLMDLKGSLPASQVNWKPMSAPRFPSTASLCLLSFDVSTRPRRNEGQMSILWDTWHPDTSAHWQGSHQVAPGSSHKSTVIRRSGEWCLTKAAAIFRNITDLIRQCHLKALSYWWSKRESITLCTMHETGLYHTLASLAICQGWWRTTRIQIHLMVHLGKEASPPVGGGDYLMQ